jgi:RNA polymerase sigma factor for flagellar operon FliA
MNKNPAQAYTTWQDKEERDRILLEQLPQVRYLARRIHERLPRHVCSSTILSMSEFGSYAKFRIRGAILDSLREMD